MDKYLKSKYRQFADSSSLSNRLGYIQITHHWHRSIQGKQSYTLSRQCLESSLLHSQLRCSILFLQEIGNYCKFLGGNLSLIYRSTGCSILFILGTTLKLCHSTSNLHKIKYMSILLYLLRYQEGKKLKHKSHRFQDTDKLSSYPKCTMSPECWDDNTKDN